MRVPDVRLVGARIDHFRIDPLALRAERQPVAFGRLRRNRVDAEPVRRQLADADGGVGQRSKGVERSSRLGGDVAGRRRGVVLVEVQAVAAAQHAPSVTPTGRRRIPRAARCPASASSGTPPTGLPIASSACRVALISKLFSSIRFEIHVVAHAQVQRQSRRSAPVVLEPRRQLVCRVERVGPIPLTVHGAAIGLLPPARTMPGV